VTREEAAMTKVYLWFNAAMYLFFAVACALNPDRLQRALGFFTLDNSGSSEFLAIYAGLEAGFALFYVAAARKLELERPAILFSICLYAGIVVFRLPSLLIYRPVRTISYVVAAGEVVLLAAALLLRRRAGKVPEER
jgi:hypothetical protein